MLFLPTMLAGQQLETPFSQIGENQLLWNGAMAGIHQANHLDLRYRHQLVGFEGAPQTVAVTFDAFMGKRVGLGLSLLNDGVGPINMSLIKADYAYHLPMDNGTLSWGLSAEMRNFQGDFTSLTTIEQGDVTFAENINRWMPNFGTSLVYYEDKLTIGFSVPFLLEPTLYDLQNPLQKATPLNRRFVGFGSYSFSISQDFILKPMLLFRQLGLTETEVHTQLQFIFKEKVELGLSYATTGQKSTSLGVLLGNNLRLNYAYQWPNATNLFLLGGHEIGVGVVFD